MRQGANSEDEEGARIPLPSGVRVTELWNRSYGAELAPDLLAYSDNDYELAKALAGEVAWGRQRLQRRRAKLDDGYLRMLSDAVRDFRGVVNSFHMAGRTVFGGPGRRLGDDLGLKVILGMLERAVVVAFEIHCLLKGGFFSGALSRWRAIHELAVTAVTIAENAGIGIAEAYVDHETPVRHRLERAFAAASTEATGGPDGAAREFVRGSYPGDFAWAAAAYGNGSAIDGSVKGRGRHRGPTFEELENKAGLSSFRPIYKFASQRVHQDVSTVLKILRPPLMSDERSEGRLLLVSANCTFADLGLILSALVKVESKDYLRQLDHIVMLVPQVLADRFARAYNVPYEAPPGRSNPDA